MARIQLTEEQIRVINDIRRELNDAMLDTAALMACGIKCEDRQREVEKNYSILTKLVETFGSPGS